MNIFPAKILLAVDGSADSARAARTAIRLSEKTGSELHVIHVAYLLPPGWGSEVSDSASRLYEETREEVKQESQRMLDEQVGKIKDAGGNVSEAHLRAGRSDEEIVLLAEELGVGLVVLGSRGLGPLKRALMGSVSVSVVRHAHCPVLVVRGNARDEHERDYLPGRILLALDGSKEARAATRAAVEIANATGSELHILHALQTEERLPYSHPYAGERWKASLEQAKHDAREFVDKQAERIEADGGSIKDAHLAFGEPEGEVVKLGEELDAGLIVTGSRGLGGLRRALLGSVSGSVVRHAHCPVLVVREADTVEDTISPESEERERISVK